MFFRIVVWKNHNNDKYYYKKLKGYTNRYYIGYKNQYDHEVIQLIDITEFLKPKKYRIPIKRRVINWLNKSLENK